MLTAINNTEIKDAENCSLLSPDDAAAVSALHDQYVSRYTFMASMLTALREGYENYRRENGWEQPGGITLLLDPVPVAIGQLEKGCRQLSENLIDRIEKHFSTTYHLDLKSYAHAHDFMLAPFFVSYRPIIAHIFTQIDNSLTQQGKAQIEKEFKAQVSRRQPPILKGCKITLPRYVRYDHRYSGIYIGSALPLQILILALRHFHSSALQLAEVDKEFIYQLQYSQEVDFSKDYQVADQYSIRLFKNERVDIIFPDEKAAAWFFEKIAPEKASL